MANSTYFQAVNRVLEHAGQATIASTGDFDAETDLEKPQLQAKRFVDKANRRLIRNNRPRQRLRKYTLTLASGDNDYTLNSATSLENLKEDTFFITTAAYARGPLRYVPYETWLTWFPTGEPNEGIPEFWFDYPPDGTTVGDRIGFSPPPSAAMTVQYEGYMDVTALTTSTDVIAFDVKFEDVLWDWGQSYLESALSEGKAMELNAILDGLLSEIRQLSMGPRDKPPKVNLGMKIQGVRRWSRYADRTSIGS
jgi:hypothetical protein